MKPESIVFAIAGTCFGLIVGWVLGSQQSGRRAPPPAVQQQAAATTPAEGSSGAPRAAVLDQSQVQALQNVIDADPKNEQARVQLANLYFDAEKYDEAIKWYGEALTLAPNDVNVSTDLGVCYYYSNQPDKALEQFAHSLSIDPKHAKTLLNLGIVKAFGKQDLDGAMQAWQQVIAIAPNSPEGQAAKRALDSLQSAHPQVNKKPGA